jgi:hypothetical protein
VSRALVSSRVLLQVQLVILLRIPPLASRYNLSRDRLLVPLFANLVRNLLGNILLLLAMREDHTAVLGADIPALAVQGRRVMHAIEELEELAVCHDGGVKGDLKGFGICAGAKREGELGTLCPGDADLLVGDRRASGEYSRPVSPLHTAR